MPLEAADDLGSVLSFGLAFGHIVLSAGVVTHPGGSDPPQRVVGPAVAAPMLLSLSNRVLLRNGCGEPLLVAGGEVVVVVEAAFEL